MKYILLLVGIIIFSQMLYGQSQSYVIITIKGKSLSTFSGPSCSYTVSNDRKEMKVTCYFSSCKECEQERAATPPSTYVGGNHHTYTFFCCEEKKPEPKPTWFCEETGEYYWTESARDAASRNYRTVTVDGETVEFRTKERADAARAGRMVKIGEYWEKFDSKAEANEARREEAARWFDGVRYESVAKADVARAEVARRRAEEERRKAAERAAIAKAVQSQVEGYYPISSTPDKPKPMQIGEASSSSSTPSTNVPSGYKIEYKKQEKAPQVWTIYSFFQSLAQDIGSNVPFTEEEYRYCISQDIRRCYNDPNCKDFCHTYDQFLRDVIKGDPLYEVYEEFEKELVDLGIDVAEIWVSTGIAITFTPAGNVAVAGPQKAVFALLKELNQGKSIKDPNVWKNVAISAGEAAIGAQIKTGNPISDATGKAIIAMGASIAKGEENRSKVLEKGGETFAFEVLKLDPITEKIVSRIGQKIRDKKRQE